MAARSPGPEATRSNQREDARHQQEPGETKLFTNRCKHQVRVSGWKIARIAQTETGSEQPAGRQGPDRLGDLISTRDTVVPRGLPHVETCHERCRDVEFVADIEARDENGQPCDCHADPLPGKGVRREKHAGHKEGRAEILLQKEEQQGRRNSNHDRQHIFDARQVEPAGNWNAADVATANVSE